MSRKYDVKINQPFACLNNLFVNGRGQLADNLATSKSVVAVMVREQREAEKMGFGTVEDKRAWDVRCQIEELEDELKKLVKERDDVLKTAMRMDPKSEKLMRTNKFRKANTLATAIRELKSSIMLMKKGQ